MCGINGIVALGTRPPSREECEQTRDLMRARGPDGEGLFVEGPVALGHRRLSILDLTDASAQPFFSRDGRYVLVFNGEIYNYRIVRERLLDEGAVFTTTGDTEVVLEAVRRWGERALDELCGMFAFAVWDRVSRSLFLARDPHGIKPLYYAYDASFFRFASSLRALVRGAELDRAVDESAVANYLAWGYVPDPRTPLRSVRRLPAGSFLWVRDGHVEAPETYWSVARVYARTLTDDGDDRSLPVRAREVFRKTVQRHLVADVDVGLFLSAGIDSTALLGLATEVSGRSLRTATLAFPAFRHGPEDEAPLAEQVARLYEAEHTTITLDVADAESVLPEFLRTMDCPSGDALNTYMISRELRRLGIKCALAGIGGDEIFGGYPTMRRFRALRRMAEIAPLAARVDRSAKFLADLWPDATRAKARFIPYAIQSPEATYLLLRGIHTPNEVEQMLGRERFARAGGLEGLLAPVREAWAGERFSDPWIACVVAEHAMYMRHQLLRDADWASMAHGLELRVPLVDRTLTESFAVFVACRLGRGGKDMLATAPSPPLPRSVQRRRKTGFLLPMRQWTARAFEVGALSIDGASVRLFERTDAMLHRAVARGEMHWSRAWTIGILSTWLASLSEHP